MHIPLFPCPQPIGAYLPNHPAFSHGQRYVASAGAAASPVNEVSITEAKKNIRILIENRKHSKKFAINNLHE